MTSDPRIPRYGKPPPGTAGRATSTGSSVADADHQCVRCSPTRSPPRRTRGWSSREPASSGRSWTVGRTSWSCGVGTSGGRSTESTFGCTNRPSQRWSATFASLRDGMLTPSVFGRFQDRVGEFHGDDQLAGRPIEVRFVIERQGPDRATFTQAFSDDGVTSLGDELGRRRPARRTPRRRFSPYGGRGRVILGQSISEGVRGRPPLPAHHLLVGMRHARSR